MEEKEIIYDLEMEAEAPQPPKGGDEDSEAPQTEAPQAEAPQPPKGGDEDGEALQTEAPQPPKGGDEDSSDGSDSSEDPASPEKSEAEKKIDEMIGQMGAETLLEIILDNRNAACRQIIEEVRAQPRSPIPSGVAANSGPASIFDLAAMA